MNDHIEDAEAHEPVDLVTETPTRKRRTPILAAVTALAVAGAAFAVVNVAGDDDSGPAPLALGGQGSNVAGAALPEGAPDTKMSYPISQFKYVLAGALPNLGDSAVVYRLRATEITADDVARMGEGLGIDGEVRDLDGAGWEVSDDTRTLTVSGDANGWYVSMWNGPSFAEEPPEPGTGTGGGAVGGSDGDGSTSGTGSTGTIEPGTVTEPPTGCDTPVASDDSARAAQEGADDCIVIDDPVPAPNPEPATGCDTPVSSDDSARAAQEGDDDCVVIDPVPAPNPEPYEPPPAPTDLPDEQGAIDIARDTLNAIGVLDDADWSFEVVDNTMSVAVACEADAPECADTTMEEPILYSRGVIAHRSIDGHPVVGLDWYIDVGDHSVVQSFGGMLATVERVDEYPLRSTSDVFADLERGDLWYGGGIVPLGAAEARSNEIATDVMPPECAPDTDCEVPEPQIIEVTVRDVSLGLQLWYGTDSEGAPVQYVVPSYHFTGSFADGTEWSTDLLAISDEYVTPVPPKDDVQIDPGVEDGGGVDGEVPPEGDPAVETKPAP